jgi:DNA polymerase III subunit gamma/tau
VFRAPATPLRPTRLSMPSPPARVRSQGIPGPFDVGPGGYAVHVVTALYRRYRPDTFADLIGQEQVTAPLMTALRHDRVGHAYLFSGPRGCGKTTSARILARCLNCAQGPTDTPCGECPSCRDLATGGPGSLDVIEIDAASHGGVDDARDLRERAVFAPARDHYKIFIIDEAHMVTAAGFNALLKLVEEPPEHVKFIFATTEPEKVIGTIRSRTHHYPFRLVPPATMLPFLESILAREQVTAEPGVLPLAVRAGGGSVRDTLSVLDQLIAGSEDATISYARTIGLLGYTPSDLLAEVADAISARDAQRLFTSVDRVIQTGQDPRRFAEDVLERLRDLIVVKAAPDQAPAILRGTAQDELDTLRRQARDFGPADLSRAADTVSDTLDMMGGTTSPRMQLELMCARLLVPAADTAEAGALSRIERLERRIGVDVPTAPSGSPAPVRAAAPAQPAVSTGSAPAGGAPARPAAVAPTAASAALPPSSAAGPAGPGTPALASSAPATSASGVPTRPAPSAPPRAGAAPSAPAAATAAPASTSASTEPADATAPAQPAARPAAPMAQPTPASTPAAQAATAPAAAGPVSATPLTIAQVQAGWDQVLAALAQHNRRAWIVATNARPQALDGDILTLSFASATDAENFRSSRGATSHAAADGVREALQQVFGVRMRFRAHAPGRAPQRPTTTPQTPASQAPAPAAQAPAPISQAPAPAAGTTAATPAAPASTAHTARRTSKSASSTTRPQRSQSSAPAPAPWPEELPPEPDDYGDNPDAASYAPRPAGCGAPAASAGPASRSAAPSSRRPTGSGTPAATTPADPAAPTPVAPGPAAPAAPAGPATPASAAPAEPDDDAPASVTPQHHARYGEAVLREMLHAKPIDGQ